MYKEKENLSPKSYAISQKTYIGTCNRCHTAIETGKWWIQIRSHKVCKKCYESGK